MPSPYPLDSDDFDTLRKRWLQRYLTIQAKHDVKVRTALLQSSQDASDQISSLANSPTFSNGVRTAQLRIIMKIVSEVLNDLFKKQIPLITAGSKQAARAAVTAFGETDRDFLRQAFNSSAGKANVNDFIQGQYIQAELSVMHLISRIEKSSHPLSTRVYRTRRLANTWVQREVNSAIVRGESAAYIAKRVRSSIRPNVPGGVSYAALRLGRTELNNAFHATSVALAQDRPWVEGMVWHLSQTHERTEGTKEICERYSEELFQVDNVPAKPHPQCRCFVTPKVEPLDVFVRNLTAGTYRDWIADAA